MKTNKLSTIQCLAILGLQNATELSEHIVKKAYFKLAHIHHPDKGGDAEKFKLLHEAYSVVMDDIDHASKMLKKEVETPKMPSMVIDWAQVFKDGSNFAYGHYSHTRTKNV